MMTVRRYEKRIAAQSALQEEARRIVRSLVEDSTPQADSPVDIVWQELGGDAANTVSVSLKDVSSYLGLNWVRKEVLVDFAALESDVTVEDLQQYREETAIHADLASAFYRMVSEDALETLFTAYSYFNINICDEFVLRKLYAVRTDDAEGSEEFHLAIQKARMERQIIAPEELASFVGGDTYAILFPVLNAEPVLNVHFAPEEVISTLCSHYEVPEEQADRLLHVRARRELLHDDLAEILGPQYTETVLRHYLGVQTWFWEISVATDGEKLRWIVARTPASGEETQGQSARFRLIEEEFGP